MTSLAFCAGSVPQVTDRRCVFTADAPPPCPECLYISLGPCPTGCGDAIMPENDNVAGVAPSGTDIVIWTPGCSGACSPTTGALTHARDCDVRQGAERPAGVVIGGKLDKVVPIYTAERVLDAMDRGTDLAAEAPTYSISLSECFLIDPPITSWAIDPTDPDLDEWGSAAWIQVSTLPAGWSVCPVGLAATIGERL